MLTHSPQDLQAILLSLKVATTATIICTPFRIGVADLTTFGNFPGKSIREGIINLPLVLPPVEVGYLLLLTFGRNGVLGNSLEVLHLRVIFPLTCAVIASAVIGFPLLVRFVRIGMESIDPAFSKVSRTLGAG